VNRAARSIQVFAVYLLLLGLVLVMSPNTLLALFGIPATGEVWIRIVGMLAVLLGVYYWQAARSGLRAFFVCTVPVRLSVPLFFGAFVLLGMAPPVLLAFAAVDAAAALWTWAALRRD
jgi:hypothetical protein